MFKAAAVLAGGRGRSRATLQPHQPPRRDMMREVPSLMTQQGTSDAGEGQRPGNKSLEACYICTMFTPTLSNGSTTQGDRTR